MSREIGTLTEDTHKGIGRLFRGGVKVPGYSGRLRLLPAEKRKPTSPDFRVEGMDPHTGEIDQIGAAWLKISKGGRAYLSLNLSAPHIDRIDCAAFYNGEPEAEQRDGDTPAKMLPPKAGREWRITWSAPSRRPPRADATPDAQALNDEIGF